MKLELLYKRNATHLLPGLGFFMILKIFPFIYFLFIHLFFAFQYFDFLDEAAPSSTLNNDASCLYVPLGLLVVYL